MDGDDEDQLGADVDCRRDPGDDMEILAFFS